MLNHHFKRACLAWKSLINYKLIKIFNDYKWCKTQLFQLFDDNLPLTMYGYCFHLQVNVCMTRRCNIWILYKLICLSKYFFCSYSIKCKFLEFSQLSCYYTNNLDSVWRKARRTMGPRSCSISSCRFGFTLNRSVLQIGQT